MVRVGLVTIIPKTIIIKQYMFEILLTIVFSLIVFGTILSILMIKPQDPNDAERQVEYYGYKMGLNVAAAQCVPQPNSNINFDCEMYVRLPDTSLQITKLTCTTVKCSSK